MIYNQIILAPAAAAVAITATYHLCISKGSVYFPLFSKFASDRTCDKIWKIN